MAAWGGAGGGGERAGALSAALLWDRSHPPRNNPEGVPGYPTLAQDPEPASSSWPLPTAPVLMEMEEGASPGLMMTLRGEGLLRAARPPGPSLTLPAGNPPSALRCCLQAECLRTKPLSSALPAAPPPAGCSEAREQSPAGRGALLSWARGGVVTPQGGSGGGNPRALTEKCTP